jgi:hypothetical protein
VELKDRNLLSFDVMGELANTSRGKGKQYSIMNCAESLGIFSSKSTIQFATMKCTESVVEGFEVIISPCTRYISVNFEEALKLCIYQLVMFLKEKGE